MSPRNEWDDMPTTPEGHIPDEQLLREHRQRAPTEPILADGDE